MSEVTVTIVSSIHNSEKFILRDRVGIDTGISIRYIIGSVIETLFITNFTGRKSIEFFNQINNIKNKPNKHEAIRLTNKVLNRGYNFIELTYNAKVNSILFTEILNYNIIINQYKANGLDINIKGLIKELGATLAPRRLRL